MNWFKKSQKTYMNIGHARDKLVLIWIHTGEKLLVEEEDPALGHENLQEGIEKPWHGVDYIAWGRIDQDNGIGSMTWSEYTDRALLKYVIEDLIAEFPEISFRIYPPLLTEEQGQSLQKFWQENFK